MGSKSDWETMKHADEMLDRVRRPARVPRRLGPSHAGLDGRVRHGGRRPRARGDHRRRGRRGPPAGHGRRPDDAAGARRAGARARRCKGLDSLLSIVQMPGGVPVGDARHRQGRRDQRGAAAVAILATSRPRAARRSSRRSAPSRPQRVRQDTLAVSAAPSCPARRSACSAAASSGRMFAIAARRMGYRVHTFSPDRDTPTGQVADVEVVAPLRRPRRACATSRGGVDVVTFEFENVPAGHGRSRDRRSRRCGRRRRCCTSRSTASREKSSSPSAGFPVTPFAPSRSHADLRRRARDASARPRS